MSSLQAKLNRINDRWKKLVGGYIREAQATVKSKHDIPQEIITLCLLYYVFIDLAFDDKLHGHLAKLKDSSQHKNAIVCGTGAWSTVYSKFTIIPQQYPQSIISWVVKVYNKGGNSGDNVFAIGISGEDLSKISNFDGYRFMNTNLNTFAWHFYMSTIYTVPNNSQNGRTKKQKEDKKQEVVGISSAVNRTFGSKYAYAHKEEFMVRLELDVERKEFKIYVNDHVFGEFWHEIKFENEYRLAVSATRRSFKAEIVDMEIRNNQ